MMGMLYGVEVNTNHYNLSAIIAVGNKVDSQRAIQFRKWANAIIEEFTIKGFAMDDERLKNDGSILSKRYFEELIQRVREIRLSERKFYRKITDIYATSIDYDSDLDLAELQASRHIPMTMGDWAARLDSVLELTGHEILENAGTISAEIARDHALAEFEKFRIRQDRTFQSDFDQFLLEMKAFGPLPE